MGGLSHTYRRRGEALVVLDDVELRADEGSYLALVGPSGSGKTTLLSILGGLERPQTGQVLVGGSDLARCSGTELADFRRQTVGFVFQHFGLLDTATALENVELALSLSRCQRRFRRRKAAGLLERVGLGDRLSHRPAELSGGERQRVGMARAIANDPQLILADEPTGNLDGVTAATVIDLLEELRATNGCTLFIATHDKSLAGRADRLISLVDGRATEATRRVGPTRRVGSNRPNRPNRPNRRQQSASAGQSTGQPAPQPPPQSAPQSAPQSSEQSTGQPDIPHPEPIVTVDPSPTQRPPGHEMG